MTQKNNQSILFVIAFSFLSILLSGCHKKGNAADEKTQAEFAEPKEPIFMEEPFHLFRERMDGSISPQWLLSDSLSRYATIEEIEKLATTDKDPIKRLVAFRALLEKSPHQAVNLTIANIEDTTIVHTTTGDCGGQDRVSNVRIGMLQYNRNHYHVTYNDSVRVDSAALFSFFFPLYDYSYRLYHNLPAKPEYEKRLRQLYVQDHWALVALAKYHKENEKQVIIQLLSHAKNKDIMSYRDTISAALHAVAVWPDATFKPFVQQVCQKIMEQQYTSGCEGPAFRALIAYHSPWSYDLTEKALAKAQQEEGKYFGVCWSFHDEYENNPQSLFKPLIIKYPLE